MKAVGVVVFEFDDVNKAITFCNQLQIAVDHSTDDPKCTITHIGCSGRWHVIAGEQALVSKKSREIRRVKP